MSKLLWNNVITFMKVLNFPSTRSSHDRCGPMFHDVVMNKVRGAKTNPFANRGGYQVKSGEISPY